MDGFKSTDNICVFAGTNRRDILDPALLRAGRFDRHITVEKPDLQGRIDIAQIYLKKIKLHDSRDVLAKKIAEMTPGYTGADISNIINESALLAVRRGVEEVHLQDIHAGADRVICGMKKESHGLTPRDRQRIAYHEAGHAIISFLCKHLDPCLKVSIIPRTNGALGFTQSLPKELAMYTECELKELLIEIMGGRASEFVCMGDVTTGSQDDLRKATDIADRMITSYGFSDSIGLVSLQNRSEEEYESVSQETIRIIEEEKKRILGEAYNTALSLINENKKSVLEIANLLLEKETISNTDIQSILSSKK